MDDNIIKYLEILTELDSLHKKMFGEDKNIITPTLISEHIVKKLLHLKECPGKTYDAQGEDGKKHEIKASSSEKGTVTINQNSEPDYLIWIYFNYAKKKIVIKKVAYNKKILCAQDSEDNEEIAVKASDIATRETIQLSKVNNWELVGEYCMKTMEKIDF